MLVISAGMQRAASGTLFNLTNDLMVEAGHADVHDLRSRYHMGRFMTAVNCNVGPLRAYKLAWMLVPVLFGHSYVVKTHRAPSPSAMLCLRMGLAKATYIYRDPRDVALSLFEYGQRLRERGIRSSTQFDKLTSLVQAIRFTAGLLPTWRAWTRTPGVFVVRYEELVGDILAIAERLTAALELDLPMREVRQICKRYSHDSLDIRDQVPGTHFHKGKEGRWKAQFTDAEKALAQDLMGETIRAMGYDLP